MHLKPNQGRGMWHWEKAFSAGGRNEQCRVQQMIPSQQLRTIDFVTSKQRPLCTWNPITSGGCFIRIDLIENRKMCDEQKHMVVRWPLSMSAMSRPCGAWQSSDHPNGRVPSRSTTWQWGMVEGEEGRNGADGTTVRLGEITPAQPCCRLSCHLTLLSRL